MLNNFPVLITIIIQTIFLNLKRHYSLKQTLRAWYEKLKIFLLENGFKVGNIDIVFFFFNYNKEEEYTYYSNIC